MATAADVEKLMTCGLCKCKYDNDNRKPKFLQCAHTACLLCLKEICRGTVVKCPFCYEISVKLNVESLPNNPYALHMLKFKENEKNELTKPIQVVTNPSAISWCLKCATAEKVRCAPSGHLSVDLTADTIQNFEGLLKSKEELMKMKGTGMEKLTMAIEERKKVHEELTLILKAIEHSEEAIKKLRNENNFQMVKMVSVLERSGSGGAKEVPSPKKELFFSQLMSMVEGSTAEDSIDTLKRKMEKSIELYEQKRCESMAISSEYEFRKKVKIAVHLYDENDRPIPTVPFLEIGFRKGSEIQQDSLLVSHAVFSLLKHRKIQLKREEPTASAQQPNQSSVQSLPSTVRPINKFVLDNLSIFKFRIFHSGYLKGEIVIRPVPVLTKFKDCDFVQKLGEFCFKTQQVFCSKIDKAKAGVYVKFPMRNAQFQPSVPQVKKPIDPTQKSLANQMDEVGLGFLNFSSDKVISWSFIFPLENFQNQKYVRDVRNKFSTCALFGHVISRQMMETVTELSSTKETERSGYTITQESQ